MKSLHKIAFLVLVAGLLVMSSCNKNYYSGSGKGGKNCGCPSHKGMTGY